KELNVSDMTIRIDLKFLEKIGVLNIIPKGAIINLLNDFDTIDDTLKTRNLQAIKEKKIISKYASTFVQDGDIIFLDGSTTVYEMCPFLLEKHITIITNSIRVGQFFSTVKNITVIITGGILRYATLSLIGEDSEEALKKYNTNKVFMSSKAISYNSGVTDVNIFEINAKKIAMKNTNEVILLLDSSKINKISLQKVCNIQEISKLIVNKDTNFSNDQKETLFNIKKLGIEVLIVD
ncbi:DeoR/GlpR family DNA-binding transcription regulator, partial [Fusobacterium sp.]|uniref:DeoR/GlpR family DNA-binding transcription regulator n=1 Tax=Fusobacterium sp. TaxID=68766 RepID=UPI002632427A